MKILITGGAGFVGSSLAYAFRDRNPASRVTVLDNLQRRGSEMNVPLLRERGIEFVHGDIRNRADLDKVACSYDVFIEAAAEPSVQAGLSGSPDDVLSTNLSGTLTCLEFARQHAAAFVFLSTSRVYSIEPLRRIKLVENEQRFDMAEDQEMSGVSRAGISEDFPTNRPRSFYGASKLASELIIQEYTAAYGMPAIIDRCGVIAGPGQFGKIDQGVFTFWMASHLYGQPLTYTGFGGSGKQVRDLLHPLDLFELIEQQLERIEQDSGETFNVGGGLQGSVSLRELTDLCREISGMEVPIGSDPETNPVDIPYYVSDHGKASAAFSWSPRRDARDIMTEIASWIRGNEDALRSVLGMGGARS